MFVALVSSLDGVVFAGLDSVNACYSFLITVVAFAWLSHCVCPVLIIILISSMSRCRLFCVSWSSWICFFMVAVLILSHSHISFLQVAIFVPPFFAE